MANILYFPFEPQEFFLVLYLIKPTKLLKHCTIITGIVACDMTQLGNNVSDRELQHENGHTLCVIPTRSRTLNKAPPRCFPLCALFSFVNPSNALFISHTVGVFFSIQWPVTTKYPSELLACHPLQVTMIAPLTVLL